jgi:hypothetical protein
MRVAPPVQARSCSAGLWQTLQEMLYALTAAVLAYWVGGHLVGDGVLVALASLSLGLGGGAWAARGLSQLPRQLVWDGAAWAVHSATGDSQPGQVLLMLDLGGWMLVRFEPSLPHAVRKGAPQWLPLSARDAGSSWPALRAALYARQASAAAAVPTRHVDAA